MQKTILIVEDEAPIRAMIRFALGREFNLIDAGNIAYATQLVKERFPDLIVLDWMLPDKSGIEFVRQLKQSPVTREIPIIMLTAKAEELYKIKGLESGADDYITKPFSPRELSARIHAVLRRGSVIGPDNLLHHHALCVNVKTHVVRVQNKTIHLTALEYGLLCFFMKHKNRLYTREQLLDHVWKDNGDLQLRSVDMQIKRLRKKLQPFGYDRYIQTVRGMGYKFSE